MRKKPVFLLVLTIVLTLLTGCAAAEPAQLPLSFRTQLLQAGACSFTAEIRADYGDTVVPFTLACSWTPDGTELTAYGECPGTVAHEAHGDGGFGYDPVFWLPQYGKTMAELTPAEKDAVSHRGAALRVLKEKLDAYLRGGLC